MDKQKQIDEMARTLTTCERNSCVGCGRACIDYRMAKALYNAGYRKIPENSVVLTREELFRDSNQLSKEKQIETIHNIILENLDYGYEETARAIYDANYRKIPKLGVILPFDHYDNLLKIDKEVRKDTADKIVCGLLELFPKGHTSTVITLASIHRIVKEATDGVGVE